MRRALLFLNGQPPACLPQTLNDYTLIVCTDGAYSNYLMQHPISIDYIIGDLDSLNLPPDAPHPSILHTPDQYKTDFEKALLFLMTNDVTHVDIYGVSGHASDHFLGNLSVGLQYHESIKMTFFDDHSHFFFASRHTPLTGVKHKIISIMPFPKAEGITLNGFMYPLENTTLCLGGLISLRNQAVQSDVCITYKTGHILVFINHI